MQLSSTLPHFFLMKAVVPDPRPWCYQAPRCCRSTQGNSVVEAKLFLTPHYAGGVTACKHLTATIAKIQLGEESIDFLLLLLFFLEGNTSFLFFEAKGTQPKLSNSEIYPNFAQPGIAWLKTVAVTLLT